MSTIVRIDGKDLRAVINKLQNIQNNQETLSQNAKLAIASIEENQDSPNLYIRELILYAKELIRKD